MKFFIDFGLNLTFRKQNHRIKVRKYLEIITSRKSHLKSISKNFIQKQKLLIKFILEESFELLKLKFYDNINEILF